jgi:hypothetical protein
LVVEVNQILRLLPEKRLKFVPEIHEKRCRTVCRSYCVPMF